MRWSEYDRRQLARMRELIHGYRAASLTLRSLVHNLEALMYLLEAPERTWAERFHKAWMELEVEYSFAASQGTEAPVLINADTQRVVDEAIEKLVGLLEQSLGPEAAQEDYKR